MARILAQAHSLGTLSKFMTNTKIKIEILPLKSAKAYSAADRAPGAHQPNRC